MFFFLISVPEASSATSQTSHPAVNDAGDRGEELIRVDEAV